MTDHYFVVQPDFADGAFDGQPTGDVGLVEPRILTTSSYSPTLPTVRSTDSLPAMWAW
ncbi:hypothetical protein [Xanthomonas sp. MUS 060]|uniref:hypothetical protein n=1 Tax=Xanthomonas sp. MUS 060 TaxID=1588031 RepID=UPI001379255D|nr:hypothetical protein [Xanthomonas sp. MUS 060]